MSTLPTFLPVFPARTEEEASWNDLSMDFVIFGPGDQSLVVVIKFSEEK